MKIKNLKNFKKISLKSRSPKITQKIASILGEEIKKTPVKINQALIFALIGQLGSGKTTFIQGFARGLKMKKRIFSPTFLIIRKSKIKTKKFENFYHIDCYRIKEIKELNQLGFQEIINNQKNLVLIEWADKIQKYLPQKTIWLKFKIGQKENERIIDFIFPR